MKLLHQSKLNISVLAFFVEILLIYREINLLYVRLLYYSSEPNQVIVLEDICEKGYYTLPHTLDVSKATKAVEKLARFHAASYYLYHDVRDLFVYERDD